MEKGLGRNPLAFIQRAKPVFLPLPFPPGASGAPLLEAARAKLFTSPLKNKENKEPFLVASIREGQAICEWDRGHGEPVIAGN